jgi:hypothetical protein
MPSAIAQLLPSVAKLWPICQAAFLAFHRAEDDNCAVWLDLDPANFEPSRTRAANGALDFGLCKGERFAHYFPRRWPAQARVLSRVTTTASCESHFEHRNFGGRSMNALAKP